MYAARHALLGAALLSFVPVAARASDPRPRAPAFTAVVLGASGGIDESDLSCVLLSRAGTSSFVALDAGTLWVGLRRAVEAGVLQPPPSPATKPPSPPPSPTARALRHLVRAVLLSHPHLDHVAGLAITSPDDAPKTLYGLPATLDALRAHLWNGVLWANFTDEGPDALGRYHLGRMAPGALTPVAGTDLVAEAHPLSHGKAMESTAFLVGAGGDYVLYLGDTGPDAVEQQGRLAALWTRVAPLVRAGRLRALFIEASYPDPRPEALLFGHLTPSWIARELSSLAARVDDKAPERALRGLTVVITHIKPSTVEGVDARAEVARQLAPLAERGLRVIVPQAGQRIDL